MIVLGLKCSGHDTGAAMVVDDGTELHLRAISEARLDRVKNSRRFPFLSIQYLLDSFGLASLDEVDLICMDAHNGSLRAVNHIRNEIRLKGPDVPILRNHAAFQGMLARGASFKFSHHLMAHAATAHFVSPFQNSAVLSIDGAIGLFDAHGRRIDVVDLFGYGGFVKDRKPVDRFNVVGPGLMYTEATMALGYTTLSAGKTMAMAAFGDRVERHDYMPPNPDRFGSVFIDHQAELAALAALGRERKAKGLGKATPDDAQAVNIARQAQELLEEDLVALARVAREKTGRSKLTLSGGVALSCVGNRRILDSGIFDEIYIQPASSDEGIPLGIALLGYYGQRGPRRVHMDTAYLGTPNDPATLPGYLAGTGLPHRRVDEDEVATLLAEGAIIGRVFGGAEYGPRALGNRSILADPRGANTQARLNTEIKHRETFRPFAPSVLAEYRDVYFDMPVEGPFMILAAPVRPEWRSQLPAVTHVDGSCRPQTVRADQNPGYHALIKAFGDRTGVYCLVNTSFNDDGEPIVETYRDAISSFLRTGLDHLYVDGWLVSRPEGPVSPALTSLAPEGLDDRYEAALDAFTDRSVFEETMRSFLDASDAE